MAVYLTSEKRHNVQRVKEKSRGRILCDPAVSSRAPQHTDAVIFFFFRRIPPGCCKQHFNKNTKSIRLKFGGKYTQKESKRKGYFTKYLGNEESWLYRLFAIALGFSSFSLFLYTSIPHRIRTSFFLSDVRGPTILPELPAEG